MGWYNLNPALLLGALLSLWLTLAHPVQAINRAVRPNLQQSGDPAALVAKGDNLLLENKFTEAEAAYETALTADPDYAPAYAHRCYLSTFQLHFDEAIADCQQAIALAPDQAEGYIYLTRAYDWNEQFEEAVEAGEKAIALAPQNGLAHSFLGEAYMDVGEIEMGETEIQRGVELAPQEPEVHRNLAYLYTELNDPDRRIAAIQEAIRLAPNFARYYNSLGRAYEDQGYDERLVPERLLAFRKALAIAQKTGDLVEEETALNNLKGLAVILSSVGGVYAQQGRYTEAMDLYQQALALQREIGNRAGEGDILLTIGQMYQSQERYDMALATYEQALIIFRERVDYKSISQTQRNILAITGPSNTIPSTDLTCDDSFMAGQSLEMQDRYSEALSQFQSALSCSQKTGNRFVESMVIGGIASIYKTQGRDAEALDFYQQALVIEREEKILGGESASLSSIGFIYKNQGRYTEAMDMFEQVLASDREVGNRAAEGYTLGTIGDLYRAQGRYAEALDQYQQALAIHRETVAQEEAADEEERKRIGEAYKMVEQDVQQAAIRRRAEEGAILTNIGLVYRDQESYEEALDSFEQALTIYREVGKRAEEGQTLTNIGTIYKAQGRYSEALDSFEQALTIFREQGSYSEALDIFEQALTIYREVGRRAEEGLTLTNIGTIHTAQGRYSEALDSFEQALTIYREMGKQAEEGTIRLSIGTIYNAQGRYSEALDSCKQALTLFREQDNRLMEGVSLTSLGVVYKALGRYAEALDSLEQSRAIFQEMDIPNGEGPILNQIGEVYHAQGRYTEALKIFQQALAIDRKGGDQAGEGMTLNHLGAVYVSQGRYSEALDNFEQTLTLLREGRDRAGEGGTLINIGKVYQAQGRSLEALDAFQQALVIHRKIGDRVGEETTLTTIGRIYVGQGRYNEALARYEQALTIIREMGNRAGESTILTSIGKVYADQSRYPEALDQYQQALALAREVGDRAGESTVLANIGEVYADQSRYAEALEHFEQALTVVREVGNQDREGSILANIGGIYQAQKQYTEALEHYQQAIAIFEAFRSTAGREAGRASFIAQDAGLYDHIITLLQQQGKDEDAFFATEQGRAHAFLDSLATGQVQLVDKAAAERLVQEQEAYAQRQAIQDALARAKALNPPDPNLVADLEAQLAEAEDNYAEAVAGLAGRNDQLAGLARGHSQNVLGVPQVQKLLDDETTLISYFVLEDKTLAFLISRDNFQTVVLEVSRAELEEQIRSFRDFANVDEPHPEDLVTLYNELIKPLKTQLTTPHLTIIPHSVLHYLPFAALTDGQRYLVDDYTLTTLPSASALPFIIENADGETQKRQANPSALILGNPVTGEFDTIASLATERDSLGSLPFAEKEAKAVAALYGVEPLLGEAATESSLREKVGAANILYLAAHGFYNSAAPLSSLIALAPDTANDGWLTVSEVYGLNLQQTDLVVLSACQTQLGELKTVEGKVQLDVTAGDDVVGLARAFLFAGTPTVVATLWNVNDETTQLLMERFYRHLKEGQGKAEALRQAQMELVEYDNGRYADPYYWAAFVLSGDGGETSEQPALISATAGAVSVRASGDKGWLMWGTVGGLVGIVMILGAVLWWRRRKVPFPPGQV